MEQQNTVVPSPWGLGVVVYDLEIKTPIDGVKVGWKNFDRMGISVGVSFDYRTSDFRVFLDDNISELADQLNSAALVVGFNTTGFDNPLLRASGHKLKEDDELPNYDMLYWSRRALGWNGPADRYPSGCKLDDHLLATFGEAAMKTASGAQAPEFYQAGQYGKLISYCLADVKRECMLFEYIWDNGAVKTMMHGERKVQHPSKFLHLKENQ